MVMGDSDEETNPIETRGGAWVVPEGKYCANLLNYPRYAKQTDRLYRHRVEGKFIPLPVCLRLRLKESII